MSYGFIARNNDSYIQIDSETPRLCAIHRGNYAATFDRVARVSFPSPITTVDPPRVASQKINFMTRELYDKAAALKSAAFVDVVGSVASGAIIEQGTNASGSFIKFAAHEQY